MDCQLLTWTFLCWNCRGLCCRGLLATPNSCFIGGSSGGSSNTLQQQQVCSRRTQMRTLYTHTHNLATVYHVLLSYVCRKVCFNSVDTAEGAHVIVALILEGSLKQRTYARDYALRCDMWFSKRFYVFCAFLGWTLLPPLSSCHHHQQKRQHQNHR